MSPWPNQILGLRRRQLFNIYVLVGGVGIVLAITMFTLQQANSIEEQSRLTTDLFSRTASRLLGAGASATDVRQILDEVNSIQAPLIITDPGGRPILWNEKVVGIPMLDYHTLLAQDPQAPSDPTVAKLLKLVRKFDREQEPFSIRAPSGVPFGTLHYGPSALSRRIRWTPYLELLLLAIFFLLILWALQMKKESEQQRLFAGMAKETAHQLGTPITSIMGWLALLQEKGSPRQDVLAELEQDVQRLSKISARFSQIGSRPQQTDTDLVGVVSSTINYFQRRLPQLGGRVDLRREGGVSNPCRFNRDLMEWVLENLIKNGIDALKDGKGTIAIGLADGPGRGVTITVRDTGGGIPPEIRNRLFEPGFSTKKRGWGMGLALVKRIVTQYHGGHIEVASSSPRGTTFKITLPPEESQRGVQDPVGR